MIAEVAKTLAGEYPRHVVIEAPTGVGKTLSYLIPGIAIARAESKTLVISTANIALQDQIVTKDLPLLKNSSLSSPSPPLLAGRVISARAIWRR